MIGNGARVAVLAVVAVLLGTLVGVGLAPAISPTAASSGVAAADLPPPRTGISPVNFTLYGDAGLGWGFSNATLHPSGPPLVVLWGTNVTLTLIGHDSAPHNWFIDYNNDLSMSPGENASPDFNSPPGTIVVWSFIAQQDRKSVV